MRSIVRIENGLLEFKRRLHPKAVIPVILNGSSISNQITFNLTYASICLKKDIPLLVSLHHLPQRQRNFNEFKEHPNFSFIEGDIRDLATCLKATEKVDYVLHQAALGSVPRSLLDPITSNEVNVNGFLNMLEASKQNKVKRFVYAASSSTYGDSKALPKIEKNIGKPLSPYAITKYMNELYADIYSSAYGLETIGLRYFNVFGRSSRSRWSLCGCNSKVCESIFKRRIPTN